MVGDKGAGPEEGRGLDRTLRRREGLLEPGRGPFDRPLATFGGSRSGNGLARAVRKESAGNGTGIGKPSVRYP